MARYRVAVDTGGTFSDFVLQDVASGKWSIIKVSSTPDDPSRAIADGLSELAEAGIAAADLDFFSHGTTVGTNALLESKVAKTGLLVTQGYTGTYLVGHQARSHGEALFDLYFEKPVPLAPLSRTGEIRERVGSKGEIVVPLDEAAARTAIERGLASGVEGGAIWFLFSFLRPGPGGGGGARPAASPPRWNWAARRAFPTSSPSTWAARAAMLRSSRRCSRE